MRYINCPAGYTAAVPDLAREICSIALNATIDTSGQFAYVGTKITPHNEYIIDGNQVEFITNIVHVYSSLELSLVEMQMLCDSCAALMRKLDLSKYDDPMASFNSTNNLLLLNPTSKYNIIFGKLSQLKTTEITRITILLCPLPEMSKTPDTSPTSIYFDTRSTLIHPNFYKSIGLYEPKDYQAYAGSVMCNIIFTLRSGLLGEFTRLSLPADACVIHVEDMYEEDTRISYAQYLYIPYHKLNLATYEKSHISEKIKKNWFNVPAVKNTGLNTCFITGALLYQDCYVLDIFAWREIVHVKPGDIGKIPKEQQPIYEPQYTQSCKEAKAIFEAECKLKTNKFDPFNSKLNEGSYTNSAIKFNRNGETVYIFRDQNKNPLVSMSVLTFAKKPLQVLASPFLTYDAVKEWLQQYQIYYITYRTFCPVTLYQAIQNLDVSDQHKLILHDLSKSPKMHPLDKWGYYYQTENCTYYHEFTHDRILGKNIQLYNFKIPFVKMPNIVPR
jgi:hypothetical protein